MLEIEEVQIESIHSRFPKIHINFEGGSNLSMPVINDPHPSKGFMVGSMKDTCQTKITETGLVDLKNVKLNSIGTLKSFCLSEVVHNHKDFVDIQGPISNEIFFSFKTTSVYDDYDVIKDLGEGGFGLVKLVVHKKSQLERAMKIIAKSSFPPEDRDRVLQEVVILKSLDHPNIVKVFDMHEDDDSIYIIIEYCSGGELFDRIQKKR